MITPGCFAVSHFEVGPNHSRSHVKTKSIESEATARSNATTPAEAASWRLIRASSMMASL
jgi:hypothetical protein